MHMDFLGEEPATQEEYTWTTCRNPWSSQLSGPTSSAIVLSFAVYVIGVLSVARSSRALKSHGQICATSLTDEDEEDAVVAMRDLHKKSNVHNVSSMCQRLRSIVTGTIRKASGIRLFTMRSQSSTR